MPRFPGARQLLVGVTPFGDVPRDLCKADMLSRVVRDPVDHHMGKKSRSVLADPPPFPLEASLLPCDLEGAGRRAGAQVLLGIEAREMLADDFFRQVALDPLRALVPARHQPVRAEKIDRVVGDALDEKPKLLLALPQRLFGGASLGEVARDLGKADDLAGWLPDRIDDDIGPEPVAVLADAPPLVHEPAFPPRGLERALG
jgi:hypothetical protein